MTTRQRGALYERQARYYLEKQGLTFITANFNTRSGEIDLIMREQQQWIFVEVRYRASNLFGGALASITPRKRDHLLRTAAIWLALQGWSLETQPCRFDLCIVTKKAPQVEWFPNIFSNDR